MQFLEDEVGMRPLRLRSGILGGAQGAYEDCLRGDGPFDVAQGAYEDCA